MRIKCEVEEISMAGYGDDWDDESHSVPGVQVTCSRCGATEESYGTSSASIRRCFVMLAENCPEDLRAFYWAEEDDEDEWAAGAESRRQAKRSRQDCLSLVIDELTMKAAKQEVESITGKVEDDVQFLNLVAGATYHNNRGHWDRLAQVIYAQNKIYWERRLREKERR